MTEAQSRRVELYSNSDAHLRPQASVGVAVSRALSLGSIYSWWSSHNGKVTGTPCH